MDRKEDGLQALGAKTTYRMDYAPEVLETFVNKHPGNDYWVRFNCPEFTSLCPITGQPDFAEIRISYIPDVKMVESKSLKLYLFSFRNHGDFHEDCVNIIMKDLIKLMDPKYIEVTGIRYIRLHVTAKMIIGIRESSGKEFTINLDELYKAYTQCNHFTSPEVKKYIFMGHSPAVALLRYLKNG